MGSPFRTAIVVFVMVCIGALVGLLGGFAFGHWAGTTSPLFFESILTMPGQTIKLEPIGTAEMLGAFGGTMLGGGLGVFAITVALAARALGVLSQRAAGDQGASNRTR